MRFGHKNPYKKSRRLGGLKSLFEKDFALLLHRIGVEFSYEDTEIPYTLEYRYTPDFHVGDNIFIETKGLFSAEDRRKHLAVKKQHPEIDIRFIFQRDNKLSKGSNTRYSDWCEKHGFKYHVGEGVPESWVSEFNGYRGLPTTAKTKKSTPVPNKKHKKVHGKLRSVRATRKPSGRPRPTH